MEKGARWEAAIILAIRKEIHRSKESRYDHRLHALLLVAQGMSCSLAARYLGDMPRTVQCWIRLYESQGFKGVEEGERTGRPARLTLQCSEIIADALRRSPQDFGLSLQGWNGKALAEFIQNRCKISLSIRQCQRLLHQFENRPRKR